MGFLMEMLLENGAVDVYYTPVQMKKNRPGTLINLFAREEDLEDLTELLFTHSTTLGFRVKEVERRVKLRSEEILDTEIGRVRKKIASYEGIKNHKYEYEDIAAIVRGADRESKGD